MTFACIKLQYGGTEPGVSDTAAADIADALVEHMGVDIGCEGEF